MGRPLRIEFPGAVHHVTARGNARQAIFQDDLDRTAFLDILGKVIERHGWVLHAYCLMGNHYHLLLETPKANLSTGMRTLNGRYTNAFNRRHRRAGHVFQGRFGSVLVEKQSHLLELCRYVVLNPVRATRMGVSRPQDWPWSSYRATAGLERAQPFFDSEWVLSQFAPTERVAQARYRAFVQEGIGLRSPLRSARGGLVLGSESFAARVLGLLEDRPLSPEHPRSQRLAIRPPLENLLSAERGPDPNTRAKQVVDAHLHHGYTQKAIADHLSLHYATVCRIIQKAEERLLGKADARNKT